jgi:hypothetical protein
MGERVDYTATLDALKRLGRLAGGILVRWADGPVRCPVIF